MRSGVAMTGGPRCEPLNVGDVVCFPRSIPRGCDRRCNSDAIQAGVKYTVIALSADEVAYIGPDEDGYPLFYPRLEFEALWVMAQMGRLQPDRPPVEQPPVEQPPVPTPTRIEQPFEIGPVT